MPDERTPAGPAYDAAGDIVGVAVFVLLLVNTGLNAALTWAFENFGPRAGILDWAYFIAAYLKTFPLSLTLTLALAVYAVGRMYGRRVPWIVSPLILIVGAIVIAAINGTP